MYRLVRAPASLWGLIRLAVVVLMVLSALFAAGLALCEGRQRAIYWTVVDVSGRAHSGDAHLIEYPDGATFLVDTGFEVYAEPYLLATLRTRRVDHLDGILITHAHRNHYGALLAVARRIPIDVVYFNPVDPDICNRETWPTGCRYAHVKEVRRELRELGVAVRNVKPRDVIYADAARDIRHEVLFAFDGVNTPVGRTDVNDTSVVSRLEYGGQSVLFSGDVNSKIGRLLADIRGIPVSTVMTAPHHGVESAAPNAFLDMVNPETVVVTVNKRTWNGERGRRMREYFERRGTPVYVSGVHGTFRITLNGSDVSVDTKI